MTPHVSPTAPPPPCTAARPAPATPTGAGWEELLIGGWPFLVRAIT